MSSLKHLNKLKTLYLLQELIVRCFSARDKFFVLHKIELDYAFEFRKIAIENEISKEEIQNIICGYLYRTELCPEHCKTQADKAIIYFEQKIMVS